MKGIINQAQAQAGPGQAQPPQQGAQQPQQPQQPPQKQGQPGGQGQGEQAVLDSQEAYDVATSQMLNFVYDEQGTQALTQAMRATDDPSQGMARLLGRLLMMTTQSAAASGKRIAPPLVMQAGIEVIRAMSEVAQANGILTRENEKEVAEAAFYDGIALFGQEAQEEALTEGERAQYVRLLEVVEQLEQSQGGSLPQGQPQGGQQPPPIQQPQTPAKAPQQQARG